MMYCHCVELCLRMAAHAVQFVSRQKVALAVLRRLAAFCHQHDHDRHHAVCSFMLGRVQTALTTLKKSTSLNHHLTMDDMRDVKNLSEEINVQVRHQQQVQLSPPRRLPTVLLPQPLMQCLVQSQDTPDKVHVPAHHKVR